MSGVFWALVAGLTLGMFQLAHRRASKEIDIHRGNFLLLVSAFMVLLAGSILTQDIIVLRSAPASAWWNYTLAGVVHFVGGWSLLTISQKKIGAARTGSLMGVTPLFGALLALLLLGEQLSGLVLVGVVVIVAGVYLVSNG
jgi:drug/metabolite transporter (DMT)-like permease